MNKNVQMIVLSATGVLLLGIAIYYFVTPAGSLLAFVPGYEPGASATHFKHGLAALLLALGCGVLVWFTTGKHATSEKLTEE